MTVSAHAAPGLVRDEQVQRSAGLRQRWSSEHASASRTYGSSDGRRSVATHRRAPSGAEQASAARTRDRARTGCAGRVHDPAPHADPRRTGRPGRGARRARQAPRPPPRRSRRSSTSDYAKLAGRRSDEQAATLPRPPRAPVVPEVGAALAEHAPRRPRAAEREKPGYTQFLHDLFRPRSPPRATPARRPDAVRRGFPSTKTLEEFDKQSSFGLKYLDSYAFSPAVGDLDRVRAHRVGPYAARSGGRTPSRFAASSSGTLAVGDVGHEPGADLLGQSDPPRRVWRGLLGWEQPGAQPSVDGGFATPSFSAACSMVTESLSGRAVGLPGCGALPHAAHARLGERQAGAGPARLGG